MLNFVRRTVKGRYTVVPYSVVEDPRLSFAEKGVALALWATPEGWVFHPEEIASKSANSATTVYSALRKLEELGYVVRVKLRNERGVFIGSDYILNEIPLPDVRIPEQVVSDEAERESVANCVLNQLGSEPTWRKANLASSQLGAKRSNNYLHLINKDTLKTNTPLKEYVSPRGSTDDEQPLLFAEANVFSGVTEEKEAVPEPKAPERDGFEEFWKAYPKCQRKVAKANCRKIWARKHLDAFTDAILAALAIDAKSDDWTKENGKYIPMPSTWLNRNRHEDVQEAQEAASNPKPDTWSVLTYEDVSLGRSGEWDAWNATRAGKPPKWSIRSREWVERNRDLIICGERI